MTDRELLEAAARAAGIDLDWCAETGWPAARDMHGGAALWNPLEDDGDAMKLADQLQLTIKFHCGLVLIGTNKKLLADEASEDYKYAIVRAAAAIGTHKEGA